MEPAMATGAVAVRSRALIASSTADWLSCRKSSANPAEITHIERVVFFEK